MHSRSGATPPTKCRESVFERSPAGEPKRERALRRRRSFSRSPSWWQPSERSTSPRVLPPPLPSWLGSQRPMPRVVQHSAGGRGLRITETPQR